MQLFRIFLIQKMKNNTDQNFQICTSISSLSLLKNYCQNVFPLLKNLQKQYQDFTLDLKAIDANSAMFLLAKIKKQFDCYQLIIIEFNEHCEALEIPDLGGMFMKIFLQIMAIVKNILEIIIPRLDKISSNGNDIRRNTVGSRANSDKNSRFCKFNRFSNFNNQNADTEFFAKKEMSKYVVKSLQTQIQEVQNNYSVDFDKKIELQLKQNRQIIKVEASMAKNFIDEATSLLSNKHKSLVNFLKSHTPSYSETSNKNKKNFEIIINQMQNESKNKMKDALQKLMILFETYCNLKEKQRRQDMVSQCIQTESPKIKKTTQENTPNNKEKILKHQLRQAKNQLKNLQQINNQTKKLFESKSKEYEIKISQLQTQIYILKKQKDGYKQKNDKLVEELKIVSAKSYKNDQNIRQSTISILQGKYNHTESIKQEQALTEENLEKLEQENEYYSNMKLEHNKSIKQRNKAFIFEKKPKHREQKQNILLNSELPLRNTFCHLQSKQKSKRQSNILNFIAPSNQYSKFKCLKKHVEQIENKQMAIQTDSLSDFLNQQKQDNQKEESKTNIKVKSDKILLNKCEIFQKSVDIRIQPINFSAEYKNKTLHQFHQNQIASIKGDKFKEKFMLKKSHQQKKSLIAYANKDLPSQSKQEKLVQSSSQSNKIFQNQKKNRQDASYQMVRSNSYKISDKNEQKNQTHLYVGSRQFEKNNQIPKKMIKTICQNYSISLKIPDNVTFNEDDLTQMFFNLEEAYQFQIASYTLGAYKKSRDFQRQGKKSPHFLKMFHTQYSCHLEKVGSPELLLEYIVKIMMKHLNSIKWKKQGTLYEKIRSFIRFPYFTVQQFQSSAVCKQQKLQFNAKYRYLSKEQWMKLMKNEDQLNIYDVKKFMARLKRLHSSCRKEGDKQDAMCQHIIGFLNKLGIYLKGKK